MRRACAITLMIAGVLQLRCGEAARPAVTNDSPDAGSVQQQPDAGKPTELPDSGAAPDAGTPVETHDAGHHPDAGAPDAGPPPSQLVWPFSTGNCAPAKPASIPGPGVVDPEDLCTRIDDYSKHNKLGYGDTGYGSIGIVNTANPYPDTDYFDLPDVRGGDIVRVTVEATPGSDFQPSLSATINGASIIHYMEPMPSNVHKSTREIYIVHSAVSLDLMISDARATTQANYGLGARSTYSVRVDKVNKTPVLITLPTAAVGDFGELGNVGVYQITLPNEPGTVLVNVLATQRANGAPDSDVDTMIWLYGVAQDYVVEDDVYNSRSNSSITYDYDPTFSLTPPGTYWVIVDFDSAATRTQYDLSVAFEGPPANDVCAGAVDATPSLGNPLTLNGDTRRAKDDFEVGPDAVSWTCAPDAETGGRTLLGRDVVYFATVGSHQTLAVSATPSGTWKPSLWFSSACSSGSEFDCIALAEPGSSATKTTATWTNSSASPAKIFIHVDSTSASSSGKFALTTTLSAGPAVPANDACAGAIAITGTGTHTVTGNTGAAQDDSSPGQSSALCHDTGGNWSGSDVVYSVAVPAGMRVLATGKAGPPDWNLALWLSTDCSSGATCLAAQDDSVAPETVSWINRTSASVTVFIHVDSAGTTGGAFSLDVTLATPYGKDVCPGSSASPTFNFLANTKYEANDYSFSASVVSLACKSAFSSREPVWLGRDHVYSYVVPAGKRLSIQVKSPISVNGVPADDWKALLSTTCGDVIAAGQGCVSAGSGSVSWTNSTTADATVYLFIDQVSPALPQADYNVLPTLQ